MDTEKVRDLLYDALAVFRHQRHTGSERITGIAYFDGGMQITFTDGSVATVTITVTAPEGDAP